MLTWGIGLQASYTRLSCKDQEKYKEAKLMGIICANHLLFNLNRDYQSTLSLLASNLFNSNIIILIYIIKLKINKWNVLLYFIMI